jgi:hypothetical protein
LIFFWKPSHEREFPRQSALRLLITFPRSAEDKAHSPGYSPPSFKEFPYEKIGIRASLENDLFRINGTIKEGGKEYIVKRGGFSGVNVVNQNPDNRISFKDMVKRVKRVATSGGEAVVQ